MQRHCKSVSLIPYPVHAFGLWQVLLYALMSPQDAYTDFHVDFGGSSVWYHIISGRKVIFLKRSSQLVI